jgi:hypothetical protein
VQWICLSLRTEIKAAGYVWGITALVNSASSSIPPTMQLQPLPLLLAILLFTWNSETRSKSMVSVLHQLKTYFSCRMREYS